MWVADYAPIGGGLFVWPFQGQFHYFVTYIGVPILGGSQGSNSIPNGNNERKHTIQQSTSMGEWFLSLGDGNGVRF